MVCDKIAYEERRHAEKALRAIGKYKGFKGGKPSIYRCPHCDFWHWGHRLPFKKHKQLLDKRWGREDRA